jgi:EAL domain-containing protein (putative c-di-GMP-specific phosphodiesterase class I)
MRVAVNISAAQFKGNRLAEMVISALAASGLPPTQLELEITESVLLEETEATLKTLHQLRSFGVRVSLDDFGTGYSSLSYLRSFPFDKIKIDRSFVGEVTASANGAAIVRAIAGLGASLGMEITAEGVETQEQLDLVRREGCTEVQGYYFSPPRPAGDLADLMGSRLRNRKNVARAFPPTAALRSARSKL